MALHNLPLHSTSPLVALVDILGSALPDRWQRVRGNWTPVATMVALVQLVATSRGYRPLCHRMGNDLGNLFGTERLHVSAFSQARHRLGARPEMLAQAFSAVYSQASTARRARSVSYGDFTLVAIDGTHIPLQSTPSLIAHFGIPRNQHGPSSAPHALVSVAWDVGANQPVDVAVAPYSCGELTLSRPLLQRLSKNSLVIADRLYANRHVVADLITSKQHLLIRAPSGSNAMREVQQFVASGALDAEVDFICFSRRDPDRYKADDHVRVRLLRGQDADHIYITSLIDIHQHRREDLLALYAKRWRIETAFRELKIWTNLTSIRARRALLVEQEIVAILIYALLLSELDALALEVYRDDINRLQLQSDTELTTPTGGKRPIRLRQNVVRFNRAVAITAIPAIITAAIVGDQNILRRSIAYALESLWAYRARTKPGRSYPRVSTRPHSKWNRLRARKDVN